MPPYGIWSPERGWYWASHYKVFVTEEKCMAYAQLDLLQREQQRLRIEPPAWRVRRIDEWFDSMHTGADKET